MLISLRIANYVLIDDHRITFDRGLNVLTGETGAGKSVILSALSLLTGERGSAETVRNPDKDAVLEAEFIFDPASIQAQSIRNYTDQLGIPLEDHTLLIKRLVSPGGRSRMFINNTQCLLRQIKDLGEMLIDIHGQHEHQSLLRKSDYIHLIDAYGKRTQTLADYLTCYHTWRDTKQKLARFEQDERERLQREDLLHYQVDEINRAELTPGEENEIESRVAVLRNVEQLNQASQAVVNRMTAADEMREPLLDELEQLATHIRLIAQTDPHKDAWVEQWQSAVIQLREICHDLERSAGEWEFEPGELERLQQRRFWIKELMHKYGNSVEEILNYYHTILDELAQLKQDTVDRDQWIQQESARRTQLIQAAQALHREREQKANTLSKTVTQELQALGMKGALFLIDVRYRKAASGIEIEREGTVAMSETGADVIEFSVSTLPGKEPKPLREVASGGEISRIMLALKCSFGEADPVATMVFDEIDVGIGGETGEVVASRLAQLAEKKQVICITHLPHIASKADLNLRVGKELRNGDIISTVTPLKGKERESEIARMLGTQDSAASKKLARELLQNGKRQ